jgi:DNA-binding CsgD family transcriptional regulator
VKTLDVVGLLEAAYRLGERDEQWLSGVLDRCQGHLEREYGLVGYLYNFSGRDARQGPEISATAGPLGTALLATRHQIFRELPEHLVVAATRYFCTSPPLFTARRVMQGEHPDVTEVFDRHAGRLGVVDCLTINAHATACEGLVIHVPSRHTFSLDLGAWRRWRMISTHLASGLRLHRTLNALASAGVIADPAEAVILPDGRIRDASGPATSRRAHEILRSFVTRLDRARARAARGGGGAQDKALILWTGLVDGRWSIVDRFESDGRRYLVAYRNDCPFPDPRALNPREAQVCRLLAYGHTTKYIAYELGLSFSTVATHISSSQRKLGASSRVELIRILRAALTAAGRVLDKRTIATSE